MPTSSKIVLIRQLVEAARNNLDTATQLLKDAGAPETETKSAVKPVGGSVQRTEGGAVIIEGVFDGQNMVGPDGKLYSVPANYASKSKLVEGDLLKLTISPDGSFIYKQIGPVERERIVGVLARDEQTDEFRVLAKGQFFRILLFFPSLGLVHPMLSAFLVESLRLALVAAFLQILRPLQAVQLPALALQIVDTHFYILEE